MSGGFHQLEKVIHKHATKVALLLLNVFEQKGEGGNRVYMEGRREGNYLRL